MTSIPQTANSQKVNSQTVNKEPWLAVVLSTIFPGIGQLYAGRVIRGALFLLVAIALLIASAWLAISAGGSIRVAIQLALAFVLLNIFNLFDAYRCTHRANDTEFEQARKREKDPWLAVFLSNIIPGVGHAYQGAWVAAVLFFIASIIVSGLSQAAPIFLVASLALSIFCIYHVYTTSPAERQRSQNLIVNVCGVLLAANVLSVLLALSFRGSVVEARYIPSGAMEPTLQVDDRILVEKLTYRFNSPQRGDVIVFRAPQIALDTVSATGSADYIKRIIGLPDETVEVKGGQVLIDGQVLEEGYIKAPMTYAFGPETVPNDAYFVLGDNRNSSSDSHVWGYLPSENIVGKASKIFWPSARQGGLE